MNRTVEFQGRLGALLRLEVWEVIVFLVVVVSESAVVGLGKRESSVGCGGGFEFGGRSPVRPGPLGWGLLGLGPFSPQVEGVGVGVIVGVGGRGDGAVDEVGQRSSLGGLGGERRVSVEAPSFGGAARVVGRGVERLVADFTQSNAGAALSLGGQNSWKGGGGGDIREMGGERGRGRG